MRRKWAGPAVGSIVLVAVLVVGGIVTGDSQPTVEIENADQTEYRVTAYEVPEEVPAFRGTVDGQSQEIERQRWIEWPYRTDLRNLSVVGPEVRSESFVVPPEESVSSRIGLDVSGTTVLVVESADRTERTVGVVVADCDKDGGNFYGRVENGQLRDRSWSC